MRLSTLLDASKFAFSGGAYARKIEPLPADDPSPTAARLWMEGFTGTTTYTLTVSSLVLDAGGSSLDPSGRTASIAPFISLAFYSNTKGLVRTWHESVAILQDVRRIYLSSIRGMDVLNATSGFFKPSRWGHILDSYGIQAFCLAEASDSYDFADLVPPVLGNQTPTPGSSVVSLGTIAFSFEDNLTSVSLTSMVVYINGRLAFSGASGWQNSWGGQIEVRAIGIDMELFPPTPFLSGSTVSVRALAEDFSGNRADQTYSFTVL